MEHQQPINQHQKNWHDKHYKKLMLIPVIIFAISLIYLAFFIINNNGDYIRKDIGLKGGTTITVFSSADTSNLETVLLKNFTDFDIKIASNLQTGQQEQFIVEVAADSGVVKAVLEDYLNHPLNKTNSNIEFTRSSLSEGFFTQLEKAALFAFISMSLVVFVIFGESKRLKIYCAILTLICGKLTFPSVRVVNILVASFIAILLIYSFFKSKTKKDLIYNSILTGISIIFFLYSPYFMIFIIAILLFTVYAFVSVPSIAVMFAALADIAMTLALINVLGMKISAAGIVAFLMLIGYSVDSDILLTTRTLRSREGSLNSRLYSSFKTGMVMTLTSIAAVVVSLTVTYTLSNTLFQIFTIITFGLGFDIINTWLVNLGILKWYAIKHNIN